MFVIGYHQNASSQQHTQNLTIERHTSYSANPNSVAPNEDLITLIGDDDDDLDREVDLSDGGVGEVAVDENANEDRLVTELKDELQMMDKLQESLVREVVLRGR